MRVATSFLFTTANIDLARAQSALFDAQRQTGSGKQADDLLGFAEELVPLVSAKGFAARAEGFERANRQLEVRLSTQDAALTRTVDATDDLRVAVADALAAKTGNDIMNVAATVFSSVTSSMNTVMAGRYVFGGVNTDTPPVNATSLTDLTLVPDVSNIFENASRKSMAQINEITTIPAAPLADEASRAVFASLKRMADFNDTEAFTGTLSDTQEAFLNAELASLDAAFDAVNEVRSANGTAQAQTASARQTQQQETTFFTILATDIENADLAQVASDLTQAQFQFEAVARAFSAIRDTNLLSVL